MEYWGNNASILIALNRYVYLERALQGLRSAKKTICLIYQWSSGIWDHTTSFEMRIKAYHAYYALLNNCKRPM